MHVSDGLWRVYLAAGTGGRVVMAAVVLLAAARAYGLLAAADEWLTARSGLIPAGSWRIWRTRVRRRVTRPAGSCAAGALRLRESGAWCADGSRAQLPQRGGDSGGIAGDGAARG